MPNPKTPATHENPPNPWELQPLFLGFCVIFLKASMPLAPMGRWCSEGVPPPNVLRGATV